MDYHLLALIEQSDDSDFNSDTELPTVISGLSEIQVRGPLADQAKFKDRQFRPGEIRSGRLTGNPEHRGLVPVETVAQTSTTESIVGCGKNDFASYFSMALCLISIGQQYKHLRIHINKFW